MNILIVFLFCFPFIGPALAELKNETEAGVVIATGNSRAQSLSFKQSTFYPWRQNALSLRGNFLQSKALGVLNAKRWGTDLRYERSLNQRMAYFVAQGVESDRFAGFLQRFNSDLGFKYWFFKNTKDWEWLGELGYRFTSERRSSGDRISKNQVRLYSEASHRWSEGVFSTLWVEYLPDFSQVTDWALNTEVSLTASISTILSLRIAYLLQYDHLPAPGAGEKRDTLYTTSLVAKF